MQTQILPALKETIAGAEADTILRQCVHCGMCNATCPTYQLLGDELDGPRGRIYLIKQVLEGKTVTSKTQTHLDRCLSCRSCETTCPSGVQYHTLLEIGRDIVEQQVGRGILSKLKRSLMKQGLSNPRLFQLALNIGRQTKSVLPKNLAQKIPDRPSTELLTLPTATHGKKVLMLAGCVQPALAPEINAAAIRVLDACGVQTVVLEQAGCCGAIALHLSDAELAREQARRNIDAWWPVFEQGTDAVLMTASGCGLMVKEYDRLLREDAHYADKAKQIADKALDLSQYLSSFRTRLIELCGGKIEEKITWHAPCTLQHGMKAGVVVEDLLRDLGAEVKTCGQAHLCCGSAGTYSITQAPISLQLRDQKLSELERCAGDRIVSANMACQLHLQSGTSTPVQHWIMLIDEVLRASNKSPDSMGITLSETEA
jgi:glycolate oxidase iron-sulfur subunit